jgi:hypothetical protein
MHAAVRTGAWSQRRGTWADQPFGSGLLPGSDYGRHPSGNGSRRMICRGPGARSAVGASAETAGRGGRNCGFTASAAAAIYERSAAHQHRAFARAAPGGSADPRSAARLGRRYRPNLPSPTKSPRRCRRRNRPVPDADLMSESSGRFHRRQASSGHSSPIAGMHNLKKVAFFHHTQRNDAEQTKISMQLRTHALWRPSAAFTDRKDISTRPLRRTGVHLDLARQRTRLRG